MNTSRYPIPRYVDVLLDLDAFRSSAKVRKGHRVCVADSDRSQGSAKFAALAMLGIVACAVMGTAFASPPSRHFIANEFDNRTPIGARFMRNADALRQSQRWWAAYGQSHNHSGLVAAQR